ncbi:MAG: hypothetical protein HY299_08480 [Verrucomicrobia bacterium]|nr:hypothetical protein [Verrucomicrobiota bacterium]
MSHRWQYSDKHFIGDVEQVYREKEGSQVINDIHVVDLSLAYNVTKRVGLTLGVPFQTATRSQAVRDTRRVAGVLVNPSPFPAPDGTVSGAVIARYRTAAQGLGDIKLLATTWLLDPETHPKGNISLGLGVLFPTGEKDSKDVPKTFNAGANTVVNGPLQNVDNSIQPGAGAWGLILDLYAFRQIVTNLTAFASGTYIATPQQNAGVLSGTGPTIWSTGDSFLARVGLGYTLLPKQGVTFTLGGRVEGSPSKDLIGGSDDRRRPGFAVSIEPGIVWSRDKWSFSFSAPVALYRNRERNSAGVSGDAAFADFMTLTSLTRRF